MTRSRGGREGDGWYRIQAQDGGPAMIHLYDEIGYYGITAQDFIRELAQVDGPVEVHINSPGGDVGDGYAIYNSLVSRPGVVTVVDGMADSAASVVLMAGEKRLMAPTSSMMIHDAWANFAGNASDMQSMAKRLETTSALIAGVYAATAGGTAESWRERMREQTTFSPEQALEAGLITGITANGRRPAAVPAGTARAAAVMNAAGVDNSPWDAAKAWANGAAADDPAAFYRGICAGEHTSGDPGTQAHWALPYRYTPQSPPNAGGVRNALSRLPQTQNLKDPAGVKAKLERLMKQVNPDYEPGENSPDQETGPGENASAQAAPPVNGRNGMDNEGALTIEGRRSRITDIQARQQEIAAAYPAAVLPADVQAEWDQITAEARDHRAALAAVERRNAEMAELLAGTGTADVPRDDLGRPQAGNGPVPQAGYRPGAPAAHFRHDIYDLGAIRQRARSIDELPGLLRDSAMRAVEEHRFPGAPSRETAQSHVARLLDTIDDENGTLARRVLITGSPLYDQAFGKALKMQSVAGLNPQEIKALSLGTDSAGGYAVPFQLDPTVILTNNGVINPLREISRVEQITGKEYDFVTSTGVTVTRVAEATEAGDGSPALTQPTIRTTRVQGFVPFSIELDVSWNELRSQMTYLLTDAKAVEEGAGTSGFVLGNGTAPNAGGIITTMPGGSQVSTATTATLALADLDTLEGAIPVRFRAQAKYLASKTTYNKLRTLFRAQASSAGDGWARPSQGQPAAINGYDAYESSAMSGSVSTSNALVLLQGDFKQFLIVDRVGMGIELIPHLFGATSRFPVGQRGIYAIWFNNSTILVPNAFRLLKIL